MKKVFLMLALVAAVFASCTKEKDNQVASDSLSQQMLGKWMLSKIDGNILPTNEKLVYTIESATKGYVSASKVGYTESMPRWTYHAECDITVNNKTITMSGELSKTLSFMAELEVTSITSTEMQAVSQYTVYYNGTPQYTISGTATWEKVSKDYSTDILATWEGHVTNGEGSEFDDGELHRWEYLADGSYIYYQLDADSNWVANVNEFSEYFVDGTLLCTRWKNAGENEEENREWWEIASISDGVMNWTALRMREDGSTYTATFQMTKVQ